MSFLCRPSLPLLLRSGRGLIAMEIFAFFGLTAQILLFVNRVTGGTLLLSTTMDFSHDRVSPPFACARGLCLRPDPASVGWLCLCSGCSLCTWSSCFRT